MKKALKFLKWTAIILVVLVVVVVITLPLTITPIVKGAAAAASAKSGTQITVSNVGLNPFTGGLTINGLKVHNPKGYSDNEAFAVDKVAVALNVASLGSDVIEIKEITILAPAIRYESKGGKSNFDVISEAFAAKGEKKKEEKPAKEATASGPDKKVIIRKFHLGGTKVVVATGLTMGAGIPVPTPDLTLTDIGAKSGGVTAIEAVGEVLTSMVSGISKAATGAVGGAAGLMTDGMKDAAGAVKELFGSGEKKSGKDVNEAASKAVKDIESAAKDLKEQGKGLLNAVKSLGK